ncbi:Hpt domain-containing protein [Desulfobacterales bacterium HSG17]|nr:Hpt domain-containing protein [Desulfobacterales bacterium HSG17]
MEDLPGIDKKSGLKRVAGNLGLYNKLLKEFYEDYAETGNFIKNWIENKDFEQIGRLAHTIKGLSGNMGAYELSKAASRLESGIKDIGIINNSSDEYIKLIEKFEKSLNQVLLSVKCINTKPSGQCLNNSDPFFKNLPGRIIDFQDVKLIVKNLENLLEQGDSEALDSVKKLESAFEGTAIIEDINHIAEQINNFDFDDAINTLASIRITIDHMELKG